MAENGDLNDFKGIQSQTTKVNTRVSIENQMKFAKFKNSA